MWRTDCPTDRPTNLPTNTARCRVACPRLNTDKKLHSPSLAMMFLRIMTHLEAVTAYFQYFLMWFRSLSLPNFSPLLWPSLVWWYNRWQNNHNLSCPLLWRSSFIIQHCSRFGMFCKKGTHLKRGLSTLSIFKISGATFICKNSLLDLTQENFACYRNEDIIWLKRKWKEKNWDQS